MENACEVSRGQRNVSSSVMRHRYVPRIIQPSDHPLNLTGVTTQEHRYHSYTREPEYRAFIRTRGEGWELSGFFAVRKWGIGNIR